MDMKKLAYFFRWRSITFRMHLFIVLTIVLTILAATLLNWHYSIKLMDSQIEQSAIGAASQWAEDLARQDAPTDPATIQRWLLKSRESEPYIARIDVYRLSGNNPTRFVTTSNSESQSLAIDEATAIRSARSLTIPWSQENGRFLKIIVPFIDSSGIHSCVTVITSLEQSKSLGKIHNQIAFFLVPGSVILSLFLLHFLFTRLLMKRFDRLIAAMNAARSGDLATRAPVEQEDEIGVIAQRYNEMMDEIELTSRERDRLLEEQKTFNIQLQEKVRDATHVLSATNEKLREVNQDLVDAQRRLSQSERAAVAGQMAAVFAHEIGSPLSAMSTHLQLMAEDPIISKETQRRLTLIQDQVSRITGIVEDLLSETRVAVQARTSVQLNQTLQQLLLFLEQHLEKLRIKLETRFSPDLPLIEANPQQLQQVFLNLLNNACDAMPDGGAVILETTTQVEHDGTPYAVVSIEDNGSGIPKEKQAHIFEPFFTTKDLHRGTGLGLSIAAKIIRQHQGTIELHSVPGAGSKFTLRFPARVHAPVVQQEALTGKGNS
jgi:two-component system, NtrC family, sensor kinase